ncbi:MAG: hypothetical protein NTU81_03100 [Candidatus Nomurabacteria bacterium]|nr:hypothetical protein [Candidatus Nomurabacteria bacterium]
MKKNIKYSVSSFIILMSVFAAFVAHAEDIEPAIACTAEAKICPDGSGVGRTGPNCEFAKCPGEIEKGPEKPKRENVLKNLRVEQKAKNAEYRVKMEQELQQIKNTRNEFKKQIENNKEEIKLKTAEMKTAFKENISKIKDEKKKASAEKIVNNLNELNLNRTNQLTEKLNKIKNVLISIKSRISKAENKIIDISTLSAKQAEVDNAILSAENAIKIQISKQYTISTTINDEVTLKAEMKKLRDLFNTDMKSLNVKVKSAHTTVKDLAKILAKVPNVDENTISNAVDNTNTTSTN